MRQSKVDVLTKAGVSEENIRAYVESRGLVEGEMLDCRGESIVGGR